MSTQKITFNLDIVQIGITLI